MNRKSTKAIAMLLSLVFALSAFAAMPFSASAATEKIDIELIAYPRGGGTDTWGHPALNFMNGWKIGTSKMYVAKAAENKGMQVCYCVQPNVPLESGDKSPEILPEDFLENYDNGALTSGDIQQLLGRIFQYGYTGVVKYDHSDDEISEMIATQLLVWETIVGERDSEFGKITPSADLNSVAQTIKADHPLRSEIFAHYNRIAAAVQNHSKIPSFMKASAFSAATHELAWDGSKYSVTLTDTNNVLGVRKYGAFCTGITQNVDDMLQSHTARTMLANSEFIVMLNQASTDRIKLAELLSISDLQMNYITNVDAGNGLIKVGSSLVPFTDKFPRNTKLYKLMTTKPGEQKAV